MIPLKEGSGVYNQFVKLQDFTRNQTETSTSWQGGGIGPHLSLMDFNLLSEDAYENLKKTATREKLKSWIDGAGLLPNNIQMTYINAKSVPVTAKKAGTFRPAVEYQKPNGTDITKLDAEIFSALGSVNAEGEDADSAGDTVTDESKHVSLRMFRDRKGKKMASFPKSQSMLSRYHMSFGKKNDIYIEKGLKKAREIGLTSQLNVHLNDFKNEIVFQIGDRFR